MAFDVIQIIAISFSSTTSLLFPALGEDITELSGVYNIGLEGIMLVSAVVGFIVSAYSGSPYLGILAGAMSGGLIGTLQAFYAVNLRADQVLFGLAIALLGPFLSSFIATEFFTQLGNFNVPTVGSLQTAGFPYPLNILLGQNYMVYASLVLTALMWFVISKTSTGLRLRAVGENAAVASATGINVVRYRYVASIVGCTIAALGGSFILFGVAGAWSPNMTAGRGFVAIAMLRLGIFRPPIILLATSIFGLIDTLQLTLQVTNPIIPHQFLQILPYFMGIVALAIFARYKTYGEPSDLGKPFDKNKR